MLNVLHESRVSCYFTLLVFYYVHVTLGLIKVQVGGVLSNSLVSLNICIFVLILLSYLCENNPCSYLDL